MVAPIERITDWQSAHYDMIIDVRSPAEFADDHMPDAVNMPVFSNEERAFIGTVYKQQSPFEARRLGGIIVARNIADQIEAHLSDKPADFTPLIHCWRGGQRSGAFARICSEIGWRSLLLDGGYKRYRGDIMDGLAVLPDSFRPILIEGPTGTAKTRLLQALAAAGCQILDLEALAEHRGSVLGQWPGRPQPSQRLFESRLHHALSQIECSRPVFIEAESAKIGNVQIPKALWQAMGAAAGLQLEVPDLVRADYLMAEYAHLFDDPEPLYHLVGGMRMRHGTEMARNWQALIDTKSWQALALSLLENHYDPAYQRSSEKRGRVIDKVWKLADLEADTLARTAHKIRSAYEPA